MTEALASDPTALALLAERPILPMPKMGGSPAIDALFARQSGHGYVVGSDGMYLVLNRPWLRLRAPIADTQMDSEPFGPAGPPALELLCGQIPAPLLLAAAEHFRAALPNEAGGFIIWNADHSTFRFEPSIVVSATPSRLVYTPPVVSAGDHIVADMHSHGDAPAFWSHTDDEDDRHHTRLSIVFGGFGPHWPLGYYIVRLSAAARYFPVKHNPFEYDSRAPRFAGWRADELPRVPSPA